MVMSEKTRLVWKNKGLIALSFIYMSDYNYQLTTSNLILQLIYDPRLKTKIRLLSCSPVRQSSAHDVTPEFIFDLHYVLRDALSLKLQMAAYGNEDYSDYSVTET